MKRTVGIGIQDFEKILERKCFYVDKTMFVKEWWESGDDVTLITRPRRFGKTLTMSMMEHFLSIKYAGQEKLFESFKIWDYEKYREMQGTFPVINLSFANIKGNNYEFVRKNMCQVLTNLYSDYSFLLDEPVLSESDKEYFRKVSADMDDSTAVFALHQLSKYLYQYYGMKVIILLDEYDTPMQEAYVNGYWKEIVALIRSLFNSAFKTNPYLERAVLTGITRVSKESIFSDLNNLEVVTSTSDKYAEIFGFTEQEVFDAMDEFSLPDKALVKSWYDGFIFGTIKDIYNPWSIINFLAKGKVGNYWVNSSGNGLVGKLLQEGSAEIKVKFETLLKGGTILCEIDEEIVYDQLEKKKDAIWSLLLASGYLKVIQFEDGKQMETRGRKKPQYILALTNKEVRYMFEDMVSGWFDNGNIANYNDFVKALLLGDIKAMNRYMNRIALNTFSYFDTGNRPSGSEPERFYHGFVLGLLVELEGRYNLISNRESGFGRYDVLLEPLNKEDNGIILEFKVYDSEEEKDLQDTVRAALKQIEDKKYSQQLISKGISGECICKYAFAFEGKKVLIGSDAS